MVEVAQSVAFLDYFSDLADPRQAGKALYPLDEIMFMLLCGNLHLGFLRRFRPFERGIPSHDAFRDSFVAWAKNLRAVAPDTASPEVVVIDGKTSRRSGDRAKRRSVQRRTRLLPFPDCWKC
jgi:hypothetical protein